MNNEIAGEWVDSAGVVSTATYKDADSFGGLVDKKVRDKLTGLRVIKPETNSTLMY